MKLVRNLLAEVRPEDPVPNLGTVRSRALETATRVTRTARRAIFTINESCRHLWRLPVDRVTRTAPRAPAPSPAAPPAQLTT